MLTIHWKNKELKQVKYHLQLLKKVWKKLFPEASK